uniref:Uncharacterized protein n=1 Tax=Graphocephala atropunctata TaxID=36148 RepID=A0A1B6MT41_9HEMI
MPAGSPIHRTTALANNYMAELCDRYEGAELLDISNIERRHFTSHGLHLRASGKQLLADLIVRKLSCMVPQLRSRISKGTLPMTSRPSPAPAPVPFVLPYSTFAEAVTGTSKIPATNSSAAFGIRNTLPRTQISGKVSANVNISKNLHVMSNLKID